MSVQAFMQFILEEALPLQEKIFQVSAWKISSMRLTSLVRINACMLPSQSSPGGK